MESLSAIGMILLFNKIMSVSLLMSHVDFVYPLVCELKFCYVTIIITWVTVTITIKYNLIPLPLHLVEAELLFNGPEITSNSMTYIASMNEGWPYVYMLEEMQS